MTEGNLFQQLMVSGACAPEEPRSLFVDAVLDGVRVVRERGLWVVPQSQIFESAVLFEAKRVAGLATQPSALDEFLPYASDVEPLDVSAVVAVKPFAGAQAAIATAGLLVSLSRFRTAATVLQGTGTDLSGREQFEHLWLEFIISNRCDSGRDSDQIFSRMLALADDRDVPDARLLDVCSQGVVWFLKRREVSEVTVRRLLALGSRLASGPLRSDWAGTSAWYRAVAMVPAETGNGRRTRLYMDQAAEAAKRAMTSNSSPANANLLKTYLESSMKEATYVTRDVERFRRLVVQLIELDPTWSISYAEAAEGFEAFGLLEEARDMYTAAVDKGVPYVWRHTFELLRVCAAVGDWAGAEQALLGLVRDHAPQPILEAVVAKLGEGDRITVPVVVRERLRSTLSAGGDEPGGRRDTLSQRSA